jgi:hypothetical protein
MKIEESFRDLKGLLGMERLMNKKKEKMEKMIALLLIVYSISLLVWFFTRIQVNPRQRPFFAQDSSDFGRKDLRDYFYL